jgi:hypothetical protein
LQLSWTDATTNDGYAVRSTADLAAGNWERTGDPDYWPTARPQWTIPDSSGDPYFRIEKAPRGNLVSATFQQTYSTITLSILLGFAGITGVSPEYDISVYAITYETYDARGISTVATGALCIPLNLASAPTISYQHGTVYEKTDVPSFSSDELAVGLAFASQGYIVTMPDYIGMGDSPGIHPYVHARSEAVASVDLLRAMRAFLSTNTLAENGQLFLCGYSQGGHATFALQRELETYHASEFPVTASAPMAGPHDLSGTMKDRILSDTPYDSPGYVAYLLFGYNAVYKLFDDPAEILVAPYDTTLAPLLDGTHSGGEVDAAMPALPKHIFKPAFLADFTSNPDNPFRVALRANDTFRWLPIVPTTFYHCAGDTTVPKTNSDIAVAELQARGAPFVNLIDPDPTADHSGGAVPCFQAAAAWFETLRN